MYIPTVKKEEISNSCVATRAGQCATLNHHDACVQSIISWTERHEERLQKGQVQQLNHQIFNGNYMKLDSHTYYTKNIKRRYSFGTESNHSSNGPLSIWKSIIPDEISSTDTTHSLSISDASTPVTPTSFEHTTNSQRPHLTK